MTSKKKRKEYMGRQAEAQSEPLGAPDGRPGSSKGISAPRSAGPDMDNGVDLPNATASLVQESGERECSAERDAQRSSESIGDDTVPPWDLWEVHTKIDVPIPSMAAGATCGMTVPAQWPSMPCRQDELEHRPKLEARSLPYSACVARNVNKAEIAKVPKAHMAMNVE